MTEVQLFSIEYCAQLILSGKGVFVKEIVLPRQPEYFFRVWENPQYSQTVLFATEEEVKYSCGDHEECYCQNKTEFQKLLQTIDQMRLKSVSVPMEGKVPKRQTLEM